MTNREQHNIASKLWHKKNKEKVSARKKAHYEANKEVYLERAKKFNNSETRKKWREDNKEHTKEYNKERWKKIRTSKPHLKSMYGITLEDYNNMFESQKGCCLGCGIHQSELKQPLCVDHDHSNGKIRGLLCVKCNSALGFLGDNVNTLYNLINYLNHA
jgi:hypothetical protein